jgi:hypothetical protein
MQTDRRIEEQPLALYVHFVCRTYMLITDVYAEGAEMNSQHLQSRQGMGVGYLIQTHRHG